MSVSKTSFPERVRACARRAYEKPSGIFKAILSIFDLFRIFESNYKLIFVVIALAGFSTRAAHIPDVLKLTIIALFVLFVFGLIGFLADFIRHWPDFRKVEIISPKTHFPETTSTTTLLAKLDDRYRSEGEAIEVVLHPAITATKTITDNGWDPTEVDIIVDPGFVKAPEWKDLGWRNDGKNLKKYALTELPSDLSDKIDRLQLRTMETDWENARRTQVELKSNQNRRHQLMITDGLLLKDIPNILCLHALCLTADNQYFVLNRSGVEFHSGRLSVSFEEQLDQKDFVVRRGGVTSSRVRTHSQNMTVAARAQAERKRSAQRS